MGDKIVLSLNGKRSVEYHEPDPAIARSGLLAVQIHAGGPMEVQFKDMMIQPLPIPKESSTTSPGFHLRSLKTDQGERKYALYVPEGYDGSRVFPVILFLHGAGERGQDGITPAQVGLGSAIFHRPHGVPALVVFPQARRTWAGGSDDSNAALAALDDVMKSFATDPQRVILTGLSMGGHGSWDLAAAHPEKFAAVVPICGGGKPSDAAKLKSLPIWSFCGDADREQTVLNMRAMVEALEHEGASPRITEYRGVGHLSWDRVYNDPGPRRRHRRSETDSRHHHERRNRTTNTKRTNNINNLHTNPLFISISASPTPLPSRCSLTLDCNIIRLGFPDVNTISFAEAPMSAATRSRAVSTASPCEAACASRAHASRVGGEGERRERRKGKSGERGESESVGV